MHQTEQEIKDEWEILKAAKDNPEAYGYIYEKYYQSIYLFIQRRVGDTATTGDLTSQVFLKAMQHLGRYKFKGLPYSAWLFRIATNQVNEFYRKSSMQRVVTLEDGHTKHMFEETEFEAQDPARMELLVDLLNELEEDEVQILELRFFEKRPFKEVAFILEITENNAKVRTYRILDKLKKKASARQLG